MFSSSQSAPETKFTGGAICPLLISALLDSVGFRWTLRVWAAIVFVVVGVALVFCKPRIPGRSLKGELSVESLALVLMSSRSTSTYDAGQSKRMAESSILALRMYT